MAYKNGQEWNELHKITHTHCPQVQNIVITSTFTFANISFIPMDKVQQMDQNNSNFPQYQHPALLMQYENEQK